MQAIIPTTEYETVEYRGVEYFEVEYMGVEYCPVEYNALELYPREFVTWEVAKNSSRVIPWGVSHRCTVFWEGTSVVCVIDAPIVPKDW